MPPLHCHIDFETRSACDLKKSGSFAYAEHPSTDILCLAYAFDDETIKIWRPFDDDPDDLFAHVEAAGILIGHNIGGFEIPIWNGVGKKYGFPPISGTQTLCTMAMSYAMALPGSLEKASAAMGIDKQKDMSGQRVMLQLSQPREILPSGEVVWWNDDEKMERLLSYCKQDVEVERELFKRLMQLSPHELEIYFLDQKINARGIQIDKKAVETAIHLVEMETVRLDLAMREVTGNQVATCTAVGQLKQWLNFRGVHQKGMKVDGLTKSDVVSLLAMDSLPADCCSALALRQEAGKSSTAKLEAMRSRMCSDGRIRGTTQYHGAGTGRWAGRGIQVQNFPRPALKQEEIDEVFEILGKVE